MNIEIITVGNEIITGKIVDSNSAWISKKLNGLGLNCKQITTLRDIKEEIISHLRKNPGNNDIFIFTGGLGPTHDDLTVESISEAFNTPLIANVDIENEIREKFIQRNLPFPISNLKQAKFPENSTPLRNPAGTAPGMHWKIDNKNIITLPGVPNEMKEIWEDSVNNILSEFAEEEIYEKYMNFSGVGESALMEKVLELINKDDAEILPYAGDYQVQLRVFKKGNDLKKLENTVNNTIKKIQKTFGKYNFGFNNDTLEKIVAEKLVEENLTISLAESCTGGLISSRLTDIPGSSAYILMNLVTYSNEAKTQLLNIDKKIIDENGAVSEITAELMSKNIKNLAGTDIGFGITGIAGPDGGTEVKPVGTVYMAITDQNKTQVKRFNTMRYYSRKNIKYIFSQYALNMIREFLINRK